MSYLLQNDDGQIVETHSISAGLDYPGVGPEHSYLKDIGRAEYYSVTNKQALEAFQRLSQLEGIIPAIVKANGRPLTQKNAVGCCRGTATVTSQLSQPV